MDSDGREATRSAEENDGDLEQVRWELERLAEARLLGHLTEEARFRYNVLLDREAWLLAQRDKAS